MKLTTNRLILKDYTLDDLYNYYKLCSDSSVFKYSSKQPIYDINLIKHQLTEFVSSYSKNRYQFQALFLRETLEYIGEAGIIAYNPSNKRTVIGYNLLSNYCGKGYASEITRELVKYLYDIMNIERIEALVFEENIASRKVLVKSGFKLEGTLRNFAYKDDKFHNICYYGMIKSDYEDIV